MNLWTVSSPPSAATTVPLEVARDGPPTGVAEAPPLDRWSRPGAGIPVTGQHPVYATGPALIFFTILLLQYCYSTTFIYPFDAHIKTSQQRTITQQYGGWYTGRWWVGCYIWYSEDGRPIPSSLYQMLQPIHQRPVYQLHIIWCGTIITSGL